MHHYYTHLHDSLSSQTCYSYWVENCPEHQVGMYVSAGVWGMATVLPVAEQRIVSLIFRPTLYVTTSHSNQHSACVIFRRLITETSLELQMSPTVSWFLCGILPRQEQSIQSWRTNRQWGKKEDRWGCKTARISAHTCKKRTYK